MPGSRRPRLQADRPRRIRGVAITNGSTGFPIVAVSGSAGCLDDFQKLLDALPPKLGIAFIYVQHFDPNGAAPSLGVLAAHTSMDVVQAIDGMVIERGRVHVVSPGVFLSADASEIFRLSGPRDRRGAQLPFDFLLTSLARVCGARVVCVVLSGADADGGVGLKAVRAEGGRVIAGEAGRDGTPRSAIARILATEEIAAALVEHERKLTLASSPTPTSRRDSVQGILPEIIDILRVKTGHDFTLYKRATLERRIESRMAMATTRAAEEYLQFLDREPAELDRLAKDLLINVTGFFRDAYVFEYLAQNVIPHMFEDRAPHRSLRIWVAGCSSGEETYSLAILFLEQIERSKSEIRLQIFASDIDPEAVASAREGLYPDSVEADVSPARLAQFFSRESGSYRVSADLRSTVVFSVQDVLSDPPFAHLDFVSCRNVLIYLQPEAQAKALSMFHFALREGGLLLVGNSETAGTDGRFAVVSKPVHLYRRVGGNRPGAFELFPGLGDASRVLPRRETTRAPSRQAALSELCRVSVLDAYGPATVLINQKLECLHFQGPTDRYLKVASGRPSQEVFAMARESVRPKLRSAVRGALKTNARFVSAAERIIGEAGPVSFSVVAEPVLNGREELLLVCFVEETTLETALGGRVSKAELPRVEELERELQSMKLELQSAIHNLDLTSQEQMAINEEALSVNEEYQSTNEELLASKDELQSLNEELNALNSQLQETLERQRTTADDLQNILYSTDVATIFLDTRFNIRFFTPATKALFNVISADVGRPLTDLKSLAIDPHLLPDARKVLLTQATAQREVEGQDGAWFIRRILPYRTRDKKTEGVVITFEDVTERRSTADALSAAKRQAEAANTAKSRFLSAASHDLRQPLQTLALLQGLLAKGVTGDKERKLVGRIDEALGAMTGMLNTLLDINQIEVGAVKANISDFPVNDILDRLRDELTYHAEAAGLGLRVARCRLHVRSDPRLLEQMIRNLLSNALKYTHHGRVLVGCRRLSGRVRIEIWDTGLGIRESELEAIFEEYNQVDNIARQRSLGLGLGLSIVKSLGALLGHPIRVRSVPGKGSVFSIEVAASWRDDAASPSSRSGNLGNSAGPTPPRSGVILIVEDDPEVRDHLQLFLSEEGYDAVAAVDGPAALASLVGSKKRPDLILADYNLPNGLTGIDVSRKLRRDLDLQIPCIVLTGDVSTEALRDIALHDCVQFNKPVKMRELTSAIDKLLSRPPEALPTRDSRPEAFHEARKPKVFVVDDDDQVRAAIGVVLEDEGRVVEGYSSCEAFLRAFRPEKGACLLIDAYLTGMTGLELLQKLREDGRHLPAIMITGDSDVSMAVKAMKAGAADFLEKPIGRGQLIASIERALELSRAPDKLEELRASAATHLASLTPRQIEVMERVLAGEPSKNIAADLGISQRTVENHRARIMKRTGSKSLPELARMALIAGDRPEPPNAIAATGAVE